MRYSSLPRPQAGLFALIAALTLGGCAHRIPEVSPADIPKLRQAVTADPGNTNLRVQLGMAEFKAEQYEQARENLQAAVDSGNQTGAGLLYLGMSQEHFKNWAAARDAYSRYLTAGHSEQLKNEIRKRLELVARNVLKEQAEQALAQEATISAAPPTPRSVAVFPFGFNSSREDLKPLVYALSDMMTTDFSVSNALTVLERARIQTLLDEMSLTQAGYTDPATGARAGRLLHAAHVVQGVITTLGDQDLRLDADVLNTTRSASEGDVTTQDQLNKLFDMEKDLVFRTLRDVLHVQLTPAEEQKIRENRASNILAFLAYGRGLRARDQGDYQQALQDFQQAHDLDPGFGAATSALSETSDISDAAGTSTTDLGETADATGETGGSGAVAPPTAGTTGAEGAGTSSTNGALTDASEGVNPTLTNGTLNQGSGQSGSSGNNSGGESRSGKSTSEATASEGKPPTATIALKVTNPGTTKPGGGE